jgi:putative ABC transport system permease protein
MLIEQKSFDQFHQEKERTYRRISDEDHSKAPNALTAFPVATTLKNDYPVIEEATRLIQGLGGEVKINDKTTAMKGYFADPSFFKVFSFDLGKGDKE